MYNSSIKDIVSLKSLVDAVVWPLAELTFSFKQNCFSVLTKTKKVGGILTNSESQKTFSLKNLHIQLSILQEVSDISCKYTKLAQQFFQNVFLLNGVLPNNREACYCLKVKKYENNKKISKQDAYKYVDYYNARLKGNKDKEVKLGAELGVLGIESELQFKIGELSADPSAFSTNEGDHKPMNPGILKDRLGKLSCSKVRTAKGKLKDKGTTYAKALQRYLNYHCQ